SRAGLGPSREVLGGPGTPSHPHVGPWMLTPQRARVPSAPQHATVMGENCGKRRDANGERESCVGSSVIRTITIAALFHPARHRTRRPVALHSRWFGRWWRRHVKARQIFENAIEIADLHRMLLHHGRHGSGELIDLARSDTTQLLPNRRSTHLVEIFAHEDQIVAGMKTFP